MSNGRMKAHHTRASRLPGRIAFILLAAIVLSGCASAPTPAPVSVQETPMLAPIAYAVDPPTVAATTSMAAQTVPPPRPTSTRPAATPAPTIPPGVYALGLEVEPATAKSNQAAVFGVTFLNSMSQPQKYRWFVKVYKPGENNSFGETTRGESEIALQMSQMASLASWKTLIMECTPFIARVFWVDADNQVHEFLKPDGTSPAKGFNVCP